jgi:hypothetical protein
MPYHTPFVCVSNISPLPAAVPWFCRNKRKILAIFFFYFDKTILYYIILYYITLYYIILLSQFCIHKEPVSLRTWATVALHYALSGEFPHTEGSIWLRDLKSPNSYSLRTISQMCCKFIHWHSHSNINPTTDSWTVTFSSPWTSDTHHDTQCMLFQGP